MKTFDSRLARLATWVVIAGCSGVVGCSGASDTGLGDPGGGTGDASADAAVAADGSPNALDAAGDTGAPPLAGPDATSGDDATPPPGGDDAGLDTGTGTGSDSGTGEGDAGPIDPTPVSCGGITGKSCPGSGTCVDMPGDGCDPAAGGRDCGGTCSCKVVPCPLLERFDSSPSVCACVGSVSRDAGVADAGEGVACGTKTCGASQRCCNASCGICGSKLGVCPAIACVGPVLP